MYYLCAILKDEASCYYHGYTLAEMSVHQTRDYFNRTDGFIVDNSNVGPTITKHYWECGNSRPFLEIVKGLTGKDLSGADWVKALNESVDGKVKREQTEYNESLAKVSSDANSSSVDLGMTIKFVDGDTLIADSSQGSGGILAACKEFQAFVAQRTAASAK